MELIDKWLDDLRSDKFPMTHGHLCDNKGQCALGVLWLSAGNSFVKYNPADPDMAKLDAVACEFIGVTPRNEYVNSAGMYDFFDEVLGSSNMTEKVFNLNDRHGITDGGGFGKKFHTFSEFVDDLELMVKGAPRADNS